jgi:2-dehydropantoate 2-reductase
MSRRIAVVGAGPAGCHLAACLANAGHDVTVCEVARELCDAIEQDGIHLAGAVTLDARVARIVGSVEDLAADPPDILFLAVKATATPLIASAVADFGAPDMTVVSWQNGIETERPLLKLLGDRSVVRAVVNLGFSLVGPGRVHVAFEHPPHFVQELGPAGRERAEDLAALLTSAGIATERPDDLNRVVWRKAILNACLNPVCAVTGLTMADAIDDLYARTLMDELIKEGVRVARVNEIHLGWDFYRWAIDYVTRAGHHKPSMLADLEAGRRTEIDVINGRLVQFGEFAGEPTPYNNAMVALVKALERTRARANR